MDGQNLFHAARRAFGYTFPNYDPVCLALATCRTRTWDLVQVRFYTGVPDQADNGFWYRFWTAKTSVLGRRGVAVHTRRLRYRDHSMILPDGTRRMFRVGEEKGIDVRIALDVIRLAQSRAYDVGILFSQDQDLSEVAREVRVMAREQRRWMKLACAFPVGPDGGRTRGIDGTDWIKIHRATYDQCLDLADYRPHT